MMSSDTPPTARILRLTQVRERLGLSRSTIYDRLNNRSPRYDASFPKPVKIGISAVGWIESSLNEWIGNRPSC
ncbi:MULTISPECIES: helix-turn-helix transcriptional regulator [Pseudomonas]|jgi:prophage regulatory protein|uniref:helix-turn-helix transcriptional regulator n=2 Tax=Pseudomonas TaxID=286 RepID=UPI002F35EE50